MGGSAHPFGLSPERLPLRKVLKVTTQIDDDFVEIDDSAADRRRSTWICVDENRPLNSQAIVACVTRLPSLQPVRFVRREAFDQQAPRSPCHQGAVGVKKATIDNPSVYPSQICSQAGYRSAALAHSRHPIAFCSQQPYSYLLSTCFLHSLSLFAFFGNDAATNKRRSLSNYSPYAQKVRQLAPRDLGD